MMMIKEATVSLLSIFSDATKYKFVSKVLIKSGKSKKLE